MKIVEKEVMKPMTVYITSDNKEFYNEDEAERHQLKIDFEEKYKEEIYQYSGDIYDRYGSGIEYIVVKSKEDLETLQNYYWSIDFSWNIEFNEDKITYPILMKYDGNGDVKIVDLEEYQHYKEVCGMYETMLRLR